MESSYSLPQVTRKTWIEALVSPSPSIYKVEASVSQKSPWVEAPVSQQKVEAMVSLTSLGVEAFVSPHIVATLPISVKNKKTDVKPRSHIPQNTLNNLRKQWIPKNELNLSIKAIKTSGKTKIVDSGKGLDFHSPLLNYPNEDGYLHSLGFEPMNDMENVHS